MTFLAGLIWGVLIAAATVALEHYGPSSDPLHISLRGNGAIAAPVIFVPLAIFWGWSWIANAYAGRSVVPIATYTLALLLGVSLMGPADAYFFPQNSAGLGVNDFLGGLFQGVLFVGFVAVVAAPIYWVLRSRIGQSRSDEIFSLFGVKPKAAESTPLAATSGSRIVPPPTMTTDSPGMTWSWAASGV